ncbi:MAG: hypothetical protein ISS36_00825 [Candidatus Aenigmarchaeota archaeon]|nr:hypothetical protein [Candidatus Aenigmarchaeota archaeon]
MVEETIKKEGVITKTKLYRELPKKVMFPTLEIIIQYLESKGIIVRDKIGQIVYTYNPKTLEKYRKLKHLEIKI